MKLLDVSIGNLKRLITSKDSSNIFFFFSDPIDPIAYAGFLLKGFCLLVASVSEGELEIEL